MGNLKIRRNLTLHVQKSGLDLRGEKFLLGRKVAPSGITVGVEVEDTIDKYVSASKAIKPNDKQSQNAITTSR